MKNYKIAVAGTGAGDIIRGCHNRDKGTAENERLRNLKFIFSYPKNAETVGFAIVGDIADDTCCYQYEYASAYAALI